MNVNRWVDDRLAKLDDASEWQPDATRARARLREWDRQAKLKRLGAWATAAVACLGLLVFMQPRACATPRGCVKNASRSAVPAVPQQTAGSATSVPVPITPVTPVKSPVASEAAKPQPVAQAPETRPVRNYKESGSPTAPITCEIYSDYECPSCAAFFRDTLPLLVTEYVQTGKVKLLHRDYPLPQHPYAKLAARYANAAGQAGQYDAAVTQLFKTQDIWSKSGDVDGQLALVLPPAVMRKVRDTVEHDPRLDDTVTADQAMGASDHLQATPTLIVVWKGRREPISNIFSYSLLKSYLDDLLARPR